MLKANRDPLALLQIERSAPFFAEYLGDWAITEQAFEAHYQWALRMNLAEHLASPQAALAEKSATEQLGVTVQDGVAVIPLRGTLMKQVSSMSANTSTVRARRQIRTAAADPTVKAILLHIESPGGTVSGTAELAADIAAAGKRKTVEAFIDDLGASAAYWLASQAQRITANATAMVGSIGTYGVVYDMQAAAAQAGIKVHVIRAGAFKGAGTPGTEITAELLAEIQGRIDALNEFFLAGVAQGRRLPLADVRALADGRVHLAAQAQTLKLIDAVGSFEEVFARLASAKGKRMSQENEGGPAAPAAATLAQLKAACPGASSDFLLKQLEAGATLDQAQRAHAADLAAQRDQLAKEKAELQGKLAEAEAKAAAAKPSASGAPGVDPPQKEGAKAQISHDDAQTRIDELVALEVTSRPGTPRNIAYRNVMRKHPDLRAAICQTAAG